MLFSVVPTEVQVAGGEGETEKCASITVRVVAFKVGVAVFPVRLFHTFHYLVKVFTQQVVLLYTLSPVFV